ncbi:hypothetical protein E4U45_004452 [Claviceps purpurea]|nr:hypothetical protein E4U45_004452 [Claviceps purpurea]
MVPFPSSTFLLLQVTTSSAYSHFARFRYQEQFHAPAGRFYHVVKTRKQSSEPAVGARRRAVGRDDRDDRQNVREARQTRRKDGCVIKTVAKDNDAMQKDMAVLKKDVAGLNVKVTTLDRNSMARCQNNLASSTTTFAPLTNINTGEEIQGPSSLTELSKMTAAEMSSCLEQLGINPEPTDAEKRSQLRHAYGVIVWRT